MTDVNSKILDQAEPKKRKQRQLCSTTEGSIGTVGNKSGNKTA